MSGSVNKVILIGNLGKDPEIRTTQSGQRCANLSIATSEGWKYKNSGEGTLVKNYLTYAVGAGQGEAAALGFAPLPASLDTKAKAAVASIS